MAADQWSRWLIETRFGGDAEFAAASLKILHEIRDEVLRLAALRESDVVLDVGAGDGLIAFGALDRVGAAGRVIFADISQPLLDHARGLAGSMGVAARCEFRRAAAEDLRGIADASVDVVTTRSVLIFVADKAAALREFHRVLRPGGRISLFEPINRYGALHEPDGRSFGVDVPAVVDLTRRIRDFYRRLQPLESDPMMDFDERDLVTLAEAAGFEDIHLRLHIVVRRRDPAKWDVLLNVPGNPNIPNLRDAMTHLFSEDEIARYERHLRPLVEAGGGVRRDAAAYLAARKRRAGASPAAP